MYEFLKIQFRLGKIPKEKLTKFVGKWITAEEYQEITGEGY